MLHADARPQRNSQQKQTRLRSLAKSTAPATPIKYLAKFVETKNASARQLVTQMVLRALIKPAQCEFSVSRINLRRLGDCTPIKAQQFDTLAKNWVKKMSARKLRKI